LTARGGWFELPDELVIDLAADTGERVWHIATNVGFATDHVLIEPSSTGTDLVVAADPADEAAIGLNTHVTRGPEPRLCDVYHR
jgi:hypothetical protein